MEENLVGYLLGSLDEKSQREMDTYLQSPEAQRKGTLLQEALDPLALDRSLIMPPAGLLDRTLAFVAANSDLPKAPSLGSEGTASSRWWRRADVVVRRRC